MNRTNPEKEKIIEIFFDENRERRILSLLEDGKSPEEIVDILLKEFESL